MKEIVNKNLISLKCVLFCFLSGVGCIFPFLPLHMLEIGLNRAESRLISAVAPCVALLGPAIFGPLLDKLSVGRGSTGGAASGPSSAGSGKIVRVLTATCMILSAVFYLLLLAVPQTDRDGGAVHYGVVLMCNKDSIYVKQPICAEGKRCRLQGQKHGAISVENCEPVCANDAQWMSNRFNIAPTTTTLRTVLAQLENAPENIVDPDNFESTVVFNPPHFCIEGNCYVSMPHVDKTTLNITLVATAANEDEQDVSNWCAYTTNNGSASCKVPEDQVQQLQQLYGEDCDPAFRCQVVNPYIEPLGVLADAQCRRIDGNPTTTFWTYFIIRILADIWPTAALALLGTACVIATRETSLGRGDVGRQLAVGTLGLAIFPPLAGLAAKAVPEMPYLVPFIMHAVFMLIGAVILLLDSRMPLSTPEWWWHTSTGVLAMPMNTIRRYGAEIAAIFAVVTLLGALWSAIDAYLPWTLLDLAKDSNGSDTLLGLTLTIGALPALPALWWAEALVDYLGHSNIFIAAFTFYCLRFTALAFSTDLTWLLVVEALEMFTLSLVWATAVLYFRHLVPRKYTSTGQALPVIAHFCLGRCIGAIIGGIVTDVFATDIEAAQEVYKALAVTSLVVAAVYLTLYHFVLAPRCQAPAVSPPQTLLQGLNSNGASNGTYSPMRVYHEERSRKGQFRY